MCTNINMYNGFLKISKTCKINCGHIVPHVCNSLANKFDLTRENVDLFVQLISMSSSTTAWIPLKGHTKDTIRQLLQSSRG